MVEYTFIFIGMGAGGMFVSYVIDSKGLRCAAMFLCCQVAYLGFAFGTPLKYVLAYIIMSILFSFVMSSEWVREVIANSIFTTLTKDKESYEKHQL